MKYSNTIEYNISTKLDSKGLTQLKTQLQQLELSLQKMGNEKLLGNSFSEARSQIQGLREALTKAFNPSLGILDLSKFNAELINSNVSAEGLKDALVKMGPEGQTVFNNWVKELGQLDIGIKRSNSELDKLFTTFSNTFRWGLVSSFFSQFMNGIHSSVEYVKELDDSLTQIMLVTDYNRDSMNEYAKSANDAAKALSMSTVGMTNASLVFAQQGYGLEQSQELASLSAKLANASQQDTATTSDQITAYMNAYGLQNSIEELTQQMDNWALIANVSAADVGELAEASQRAASMANAVGVSGEQLAAQIATIESVTREAPEQIGNGLKTLYARFSDIASGKEDEDGFTLGKVTSELQKIGVQVLDSMGQIRDVGDIMEDLMVIWDDLDQTSKVAASQALAGKYQVNRFMALMDNTDMYQEYKGATGEAATGTLDQMNQEYADSLAGRVQKLQTTMEGIFSNIFNTDSFYPFIEVAQKALDIIDNLTESIGGGIPVLTTIGSLFARIFSKNIAQEITNTHFNDLVQDQRSKNLENKPATLSNLGVINPDPNNANSQAILDYVDKLNKLQPNLSQEQWTQGNAVLEEMVQNANAAVQANAELDDQLKVLGTTVSSVFGTDFAPFIDEGVINTSFLQEFLQEFDSEGLKGLFTGSKEDIQETTRLLSDFNVALQLMEEEFGKAEKGQADFTDAATLGRDALAQLKQRMSPDDFEKLSQVFLEAADTLENWEGDTDKAGESVSRLSGQTAKLIKLMQEMGKVDLSPDQLEKMMENAEKANMKKQAAEGAAEGSNALGSAFLDAGEYQSITQEVVNTVGALGQLSSAILSVQNLGSIWTNDNLSGAEKFLQTIMNVSMVAGQFVSAFDQMKKAKQTFDNILNSSPLVQEAQKIKQTTGEALKEAKVNTDNAKAKLKEAQARNADGMAADAEEEAIKDLAKAKKAELAATAADQAAERGLTVAKEEATIATGGLAVATGMLKKALDLLTGPVGIILTVLTTVGMAAWNAYQESVEQMKEDAEEAYNQAKEAAEKADEIRSQFKDFSDKVDVFKESGEGGKELIEEAEKIAESIKEAGHESEALEVHLAAVKAEALGTAEAYEDLAKTMDEQTLKASDNTNLDVISSGSETLKLNDTSVDEVIEKEQRVKELKKEIAELDPFADDYERQKSTLEAMVEANEKWLSDNKEQVEVAHQITDAYASMSGIQLGLQQFGVGSDTGALLNFFSNNVEGFDKLSYVDQLDMALQYVTDDAQRAALEVEQLLQNNDNFSNGDPFSQMSLRRTRDVLNESGFTSDQQLKILATLDEDASQQEIENKIKDIQQRMQDNGDSFNLALNPTDPEEAKKMTLSDFGSMDTGGLDADVDAEEFSNLGKYLAQTAEAAEDLPDYLAYDADALADFTEAILRYDDAVETATDKMDDWEDTLVNARGNSQKMANVTEKLAETYSDLLDLDPDSILGLDFTGSIDNLEDLKLAIEGDEDAYKRLQQAAMKEITPNVNLSDFDGAVAALDDINAGIEAAGLNLDDFGITATNTVDLMSQTAAALDAMDWEVDPVLDDGAFIAGLNNLIASGAMTSEQVQESLAAMGYDVELEPVQEEVENPSTAYGMVASIEPEEWEGSTPLPGGGGSALANGAVVDMPNTASIKGSVPTIHYTAEPLDTTSIETKAGVGMKVTTGGGQTSGGNTQIKSIKKKADGGQKSGHSTHGGGGGGTGGGGGGKGGGGGGGGKGKEYTPKTKEKVKYDTDRYEKVNTELSKIKEVLEGIEQETDRLYGDAGRANVNKRITLLGQEIDLEREKLRIQKEENAEIKKQLADKGVEFDSNGFISNYNEIIKSYEKRSNELRDEYNNAKTEAEQERIEKEIEALDKEYETVKKGMDRYDELRSEIEATTNEIESLKDAIEDLNIKVYQASLDAIDNLKELNELGAKLDGFWSGYEIDSPFRKIIEDETVLDGMFEGTEEDMEAMRQQYQSMADEATKAAEAATDPYEKATQRLKAEYFQDQADKVGDNGVGAGTLDMRLQQLQELQRWMDNPDAEDNPFGDNTQALYEAYEETYKALGNDLLEAEKAAEELQQHILDGYDDIADKQKENLEDFDRVNDRLDHYSKMFELINGPGHYKENAELLDNMMKNTLASLEQAQNNLDYWTQKYNEAVELGYDQREIDKFKDEMINAQEEVWSRAEQYAQQAFDKVTNLVKQQNVDLVQSLLGNDMESITRDWERDKEYANQYLDTVQRTYETEKLRSKYLDLLDSAQNTSLATQNKIRQAMADQVSYMEDQAYLSEYNVKYANARLDVLQKQIALENAQQNKNQMKLKRDSQGNYKYVYSANEGDVRGAQQDLLDSEFNAYDMSKDNMMQTQDQALAIIRRFTDQRLEIFENYYGDAEKIKEELQKLTEDTQRDLAALGEEYEDSFFGMIESVSWMADSGVESFNNMATDVLEGLETKSFESLEQVGIYVNGAIDGVLTSINDNLPAFDDSMNATLAVVATFHTEIDTMSGAIGQDFRDINDVMSETTQQTNDLKEATIALNEALGAEDQKLQDAQAKLAVYEDALQKSKDDTSALRKALEQARAETEAKTQEARNYKTVATRKLAKGEDFVIPAGTRIYYAKNASQEDSSGNKYMTFPNDKRVTIRELNNDTYGVGVFPADQKNPTDMKDGHADPTLENEGADKGKGRREQQMWWVDPNLARVQILASMDTGGYTGSWSGGMDSKGGRLAMLHQKELVLNAADTQNILQAVEVMREAVKVQQLSGITSAAMLNLTAKSVGGGDTIEQRVEITATFPNVNTASEIEQALLSLSDQAYQYSHKTR